MSKVSFTDRLRYAFDNTMSKGPIALIGWLAVLSLVVNPDKSVPVTFAEPDRIIVLAEG